MDAVPPRMPPSFETRAAGVAPARDCQRKTRPRPAARPKPPAPKVDTSEFAAEGWRFRSATGPISGASELLALARRLADPYTPGDTQSLPFCVHGATRSLKPCVCGSALVMGMRMHLPEAVFGSCSLTLTHEASGLDHLLGGGGAPLLGSRLGRARQPRAAHPGGAAARVARAHDRRSDEGRRRLRLDVLLRRLPRRRRARPPPRRAAAPPAAGGGRRRRRRPRPAVTALALDLLGSLSPAVRPLATAAGPCGVDGPCAPRAAPPSHAAPPPPPPPPAWSAHRGRGLEADGEAGRLLRSREPILWSADVPLYEDALRDHGAVALRARIRVMPSCFLVLLTHYLRVDGVMVRQRRRTPPPPPPPPASPARHHRRHPHSQVRQRPRSSINSGAASCCARERRTRARRAAARRPRHGDEPDEREGCGAPHSEAAEELVLAALATPAEAAAAAAAATDGSPRWIEPRRLTAEPLAGDVSALSVSSDGRWVATAGTDDGELLLMRAPAVASSAAPTRWCGARRRTSPP